MKKRIAEINLKKGSKRKNERLLRVLKQIHENTSSLAFHKKYGVSDHCRGYDKLYEEGYFEITSLLGADTVLSKGIEILRRTKMIK